MLEKRQLSEIDADQTQAAANCPSDRTRAQGLRLSTVTILQRGNKRSFWSHLALFIIAML
jgi:hypothetical protein